MKLIEWMERHILRIADMLLPGTLFDKLVLERRRRVNNVTGYYPEAVFFSKEKSKKRYCVVRYTMPTMGLMAAGIQYVFWYRELIKRGYIPIVDLEYAYTYKQGKLGECNIWDFCFEQPITAKEVMKEKYVLATGSLLTGINDDVICLELNNDENDHFIHLKKEGYKAYYAKAKKYAEPIWRVKAGLLEELEEELLYKMQGHKVLGVFLREKFSSEVKYYNDTEKDVFERHPLLPNVNKIIEIIKEQLVEWDYDYIFLSTVYKESIELFEKEFVDKVIYVKRDRISINIPQKSSLGISEKEAYERQRSNTHYFENDSKAYVKEIVALSRCNYLIGGASSGMIAALVMNGGKYEDIYVLEDVRKIQRY